MSEQPWYSEQLAYYHDRDAETNGLSTPTSSERIRLAAFWLVDFVTPEVLPRLIDALQGSPLNSRDRLGPGELLSEWFGETRTSPLAGGSINLPVCVHPAGGWFPATRCEDLPEEVSMVQVSITALTPGLQSVVSCFHLTDAAQRVLAEALERPRETKAEETQSKSVSFIEPAQQKGDEARLMRTALHSMGAAWLSRNIPGVFTCSDAGWINVPTCDLIITRNRKPLAPRRRRISSARDWFSDYMHVLGLEESWDTWESDALPGFRLEMPDNTRQFGYSGITLAARERDIAGFAEPMYGRELLHRTAHKLNDVLPDLLVTWGLHQLARHQHAALAEHRDSWNDATLSLINAADRTRQAATTMGKIADARALSRDLMSITEGNHWLQYRPLTLQPTMEVARKWHEELHASVVYRLREEAKALDLIAADLEVMTTAGSNLAAASANLSLQGQMTALTRWLVVFTIGLALMTMVLIYQSYLTLKK